LRWVATSCARGASPTDHFSILPRARNLALALILLGLSRDGNAPAGAETLSLSPGAVHDRSAAQHALPAAASPVAATLSVATTRTPSNSFPGSWRSRSVVISFGNIEGIILVPATLRGASGLDTTGTLVLDTGAGYVALDAGLTGLLGIDTSQSSPAAIGIAALPLPRLEVGGLQFDQVSPILTIDANIVRQVTDRPVLGMLGAKPIVAYAVLVDYARNELAFITMPNSGVHGIPGADTTRSSSGGPNPLAAPERRTDQNARIDASRAALGDALHGLVRPVLFRLRGDGKILVSARVANPDVSAMSDTLTLVVDTGATKTALFASALANRAPRFERWRTLLGLTAPTLVGSAEARIARVPMIEVLGDSADVHATQVDVAIIDSPLVDALSADVGEPVHGLLGYSFMRRFRLVIDYPHQVLWLESVPHTYDERPYEYTHVGIQLERRGTALSVVGIASGSPAALAGIKRADEIVAIDGTSVAKLNVLEASRRLEGRSGTAVVLRVLRGEVERTVRLKRRRLL